MATGLRSSTASSLSVHTRELKTFFGNNPGCKREGPSDLWEGCST